MCVCLEFYKEYKFHSISADQGKSFLKTGNSKEKQGVALDCLTNRKARIYSVVSDFCRLRTAWKPQCS